MNGDGHLDLVGVSLVAGPPTSGIVTVFLNRTGAFDRHDFAIGPTPTSLVTLADLRKRGILDLLVDNNGTTLPIFVGQP